MIFQVLSNSIFSLLLLASCRQANPGTINQIYDHQSAKVIIIHEPSGLNVLSITRESKDTYRSELDDCPYEIQSVSKDSICIDRFRYTREEKYREKQGVEEIWKSERVDDALRVVVRNIYLTGSANLGTQAVDSVKREDGSLYFFIKDRKERIDPNKIFYDGDTFYRTTIEGGMRVHRKYRLSDETFIKRYSSLAEVDAA